MAPVVKPIPAAVKAQVLDLLQQAKALLAPHQLTLTDEEERRLAPTSMGRESISFVQKAGQLMAKYPNVLTRAITDEMIAEHPTLLQTFEDADDLMLEANAIRDLLKTVRKVAGNTAMGRARTAYRNGQDDKGRTPGLADLLREMKERFDQDEDDNPAEPKQ